MGCAMPEGEQGMNVARIVAQRAGLPDEVPAQTVNRFCASGLQTIALAAQQIMSGMAQVVVAGGAESMSMVPMSGNKFAPNPYLAENDPALYMSMGLTAENVAHEYSVSREDQDAFAYRSHQNAIAAIAEGKFKDEVIPVEVELAEVREEDRSTARRTLRHRRGAAPRHIARTAGGSKPVFHARGSVTAGNSSQTSDGAAAVVVMSRRGPTSLG